MTQTGHFTRCGGVYSPGLHGFLSIPRSRAGEYEHKIRPHVWRIFRV